MKAAGVYEQVRDKSDTSQLWDIVRGDSHLVFREQALVQLADAGDEGVLPYCLVLLKGDIDEWFASLSILSRLRSQEARRILMKEYSHVDSMHSPFVMKALLGNLTQKRVNERTFPVSTAPVLDIYTLNEPY